MTKHILEFSGLSDRDRKKAAPLPKFGKTDRVELRVQGEDGDARAVVLPPSAVEVVEIVLTRLLRGERIAVLSEDQELSPTEASAILGISRPLVVLRMDRGELPFRYVGKHRRARLQDVLTLKTKLDARQASLDALAEDTESLMRDHGL